MRAKCALVFGGVFLRLRWSVPMMMSITHRGTGIGLSGGNTSVFSIQNES